MIGNMLARLRKLEVARSARQPPSEIILFGTAEDVERQYREALSEGRIKPDDPLMRIIMIAPTIDETGKVVR